MTADAPLPPLPPRVRDAHKASVGRVLVVGGSLGMAGAPSLAARGALRAGAGLVTVAVPRAIAATVAGFQAEAMVLPLPSETEGFLDATSFAALAPHLARCDALVVGPGLGREPGTEVLVRRLVEVSRALVLDADGLHAVRASLGLFGARAAPLVLTPHEGEAARVLDTDVSDVRADREGAAKRLAVALQGVCVLKGPSTLVTDGTRARRNTTGGPLLATGGTGDVLAGVVGAFLAGLPATGGDAFGAAVLAAHVHGRAADRLAARRGDRGSLASEVADELPEALRELVAASAVP